MTSTQAVVVAEDFKRDQTGRPIVTKERRAELVESYRASGLTMKQFAKKEGINWLTLAKWSSFLKADSKPVRFAEMTLPRATPGWAFEVTLPSGITVRASSAPGLVELLERIAK